MLISTLEEAVCHEFASLALTMLAGVLWSVSENNYFVFLNFWWGILTSKQLSYDFFFCPGKFGNKVEIFEKHGLESLIRLLASTDCDIQVNNLQWNLLHFGLYKVNFALINYSFFPFDDNIFTEKCRGVYFTFGRRLPESHCH